MNKSLLVLVLLLFHTMTSTSEKKTDRTVDIDNLLREGYTATELDRNKDVVILIGNTKTGQSTLSKFLRQHPTLQIVHNAGQGWEFTDGDVTIGSKLGKTKTIIPNVGVDEETRTQLIDCAGFQKKLSPQYDLLNGFLNKKILESNHRVKIVIVENFVNLHGQANQEHLIHALQQTVNLIGPNIESFKGSIGLIASKVTGEDSEEELLSLISKFLKETLQDLSTEFNKGKDNIKERNRQSSVIALLKSLCRKEKVQLFRRPENINIDSTIGNVRKLRQFVFKTLTFSTPYAQEFPIAIAPTTVDYINEKILEKRVDTVNNELKILHNILLRNLEESISVNLVQNQRKTKKVILFCENYLKIVAEVDSFEHLELFAKRRSMNELQLREIRFQVDFEKFLHQAVGKNVHDFEKNAISDFKASIITSVQLEMKFNLFLDNLMNDYASYEIQRDSTSIDQEIAAVTVENFKIFAAKLRDWGFSEKTALSAAELSPTETNIESLKSAEPSRVEVEVNNDIMTVSGRFIVLSQIKEKLLDKPSIAEIALIAGEKIFIDDDLTLKNTHLILIALVVEVVKEQRVRLYGEKGEDHLGHAENCDRQRAVMARGAIGNAGFSSGTFTVMALDFPKELQLISQGGDGGDGQKGGERCDVEPSIKWPKIFHTVLIAFHIAWKQTDTEFKYINTNTLRIKKLTFLQKTGGEGGVGGPAGTLPGDLCLLVKNSEAIQNIQKTLYAGRSGASGQIGLPSKSGTPCFFRDYSCQDKYKCFLMSKDGCMELPPPYDSNAQSISITRHKFKKSNLLQQVFGFLKVVSRLNIFLHEDTAAGQFLNFVLTSNEVSHLTPKDYLNLIETTEAFFVTSYQVDLRDVFQRKHFFYSSMLQSVRKWRQINTDISDSVTVAEMTLISLLDILQSFLHGKQVVQLSAMVDAQLARLSDVDKAIEQVGKFEAVDSQKKFLRSKIADGEKLMKQVFTKNMEEVQFEVDAQFSVLITKTEEIEKHYKKIDKVLVQHKKIVSKQLLKNVLLSVFNVVSICAGILYPPLALVGPVVTQIADAATPALPQLNYDNKVMRGIRNSKMMFDKLATQKSEQQQNAISSAKDIIEADDVDNFLKDSNKSELKKMFEKAKKDPVHAMNLNPLFSAVDKDLETRIDALTDSIADSRRRIKLTVARKRVQTAMYVADSGVVVAKAVHQYKDDKSKLDQVKSAIKQNKKNLKELETYKKNLQDSFKPLVDQMVDSFESMEKNMMTKNEFELLFQRLDLKGYVRKCISTVQKLTQDFIEKDEGFSLILNNLQELLSTMLEAYEKIDELRYRVPLADFAGKLAGVNCLSASDPDECQSLKKALNTIKTNQLVREFAHVFAAYRQVSFPFGASRMQLINAEYLSLCSAPKEKLVELLRSALTTIRDDLLSVSTSAQNHVDAEVMFTTFNSQFTTTRPFFVWPNTKYSQTISQLMNGAQVALMASALEPGVRNAAKFSTIGLNIKSNMDEDTDWQFQRLLRKFQIEMVRTGESYLRCGYGSQYFVGDAYLNFTVSFERDDKGDLITKNSMHKKVGMGDVPLSPYALWKFKLIPVTDEDPRYLFSQLSRWSDKVDLELVGVGNYVVEGAAICDSDLSKAYKSSLLSLQDPKLISIGTLWAGGP